MSDYVKHGGKTSIVFMDKATTPAHGVIIFLVPTLSRNTHQFFKRNLRTGKTQLLKNETPRIRGVINHFDLREVIDGTNREESE